MILSWLIILLMAAGILSWIAGRFNPVWPKAIALISLLAGLVITLVIWMSGSASDLLAQGKWIREIRAEWIPRFGIEFHLAMDGISLLLVVLTMFLGMIAVMASWKEIGHRPGFFHFNLLWVLAGITGVFLAMDLFLFYFFWEVMLIPMYFIIAIWGHEKRVEASYKFFIFTQAGGLLMFIAILALYFIHGKTTGSYTFNYREILLTFPGTNVAPWIMAGFMAAFLVKLPAVPVHSWLPAAHTQAPTAGSIILAGLLLKTGAYGLFRFIIPLFPDASRAFAPAAMIVGIVGILYGAKLAFAQKDLKRLIAYTSISHMGFVIIGVFAFNSLAFQGAFMQILAHGISTGALFMIAGALQERLHTRNLEQMGGFWSKAPKMGGISLVFVLASLGLPGLANFVGEFMVLTGVFINYPVYAIIAALGFIASVIYALYIMQKVFFGKERTNISLKDFSAREMIMGLSMVIVIIWLGLFPNAVFKTSQKPMEKLEQTVERSFETAPHQNQKQLSGYNK
mgnify:CR=1 FL=1